MNPCGDENCSLATPDEEPPGKKEPPSYYFASASGYSQSTLTVADPPLSGISVKFPLTVIDPSRAARRHARKGQTRVETRWRRFPVTADRRLGVQWPMCWAPLPRPERNAPRRFRDAFFPEATDDQWDDWRWQVRHRIRTPEQFVAMLQLSDTERNALLNGGTMLPVGVTPYYMSLIDPVDPLQPLRRTVVPTTAEFTPVPGEADDPLGEDGHSPVPGLVHRYPDRVLLLPLDFCSTYCRYCTRSRVVGHGEIVPNEARLDAIFDYLEQATEVRDVLISGGDPLALSDDRLDCDSVCDCGRSRTSSSCGSAPRCRPSCRSGSRRSCARCCDAYHPLWMSIHFMHPDECTPESAAACGRLADAGIPLGSQTVLLKGVNDNVETMKQLVHKLLHDACPSVLPVPMRSDQRFVALPHSGVEGVGDHRGLRGHTTGYAVPTYVIDAPGGGGKIPLQPDNVVGRDGDYLLLRNFEGKTFRYPDPEGA